MENNKEEKEKEFPKATVVYYFADEDVTHEKPLYTSAFVDYAFIRQCEKDVLSIFNSEKYDYDIVRDAFMHLNDSLSQKIVRKLLDCSQEDYKKIKSLEK